MKAISSVRFYRGGAGPCPCSVRPFDGYQISPDKRAWRQRMGNLPAGWHSGSRATGLNEIGISGLPLRSRPTSSRGGLHSVRNQWLRFLDVTGRSAPNLLFEHRNGRNQQRQKQAREFWNHVCTQLPALCRSVRQFDERSARLWKQGLQRSLIRLVCRCCRLGSNG